MKRTPTTKANPLSPIALAAAVTVAAMAGACDEFSFVSLLTLPAETVPEALLLTADRDSVPSGSSVALEASGGTPPYTFTLAGSDLYEPTKSLGLGTIENSVFTAGQAIGKVLITVEDAAGVSATTEATVLPCSPTISIAAEGNLTGSSINANFRITWDHPLLDLMRYFLLEKAIDDGAFEVVGQYSPSVTQAEALNQKYTVGITFRLTAIADTYESEPVERTFIATP